MTVRSRSLPRGLLAGMLLLALPPAFVHPATVPGYQQTNLVADTAGAAARVDPNLVNPWGIAVNPAGPLWIADNGKGVSTVYQGNGTPVPKPEAPLVVTLPLPSGKTGAAAPTGIVFNDTAGFTLAAGKPALYLFATEDGTISGWNSTVDATHALLKVDRSSTGAVYKGLALANNQIFAANFHDNAVEVFNADFSPAGSFTDATVPAGFAPFNVQNVGGTLYVAYAKQDADKHDDVKAPGNGFVDRLDPATHAFTRLISGLTADGKVNAPLNSPWGLALAPANFGAVSNMLLVGNFGDGQINAFDPKTGALVGPLKDPGGKVIALDGLWGLAFGTTPDDPTHPHLFFAAGPGDEKHGLFGRLDAIGA